MLIWSLLMFALGAAAFLDAFFNYGELFRGVNAILFMLLSLGLLVRTSMLMRLKRTEKILDRTERLLARNAELENIVQDAEKKADDRETSRKVLY
jgi:hypothetical protein